MPGALIVLCGPPLPGRWRLARALGSRLGARRLPWHALPRTETIAAALAHGECVIVDGDLATVAERRAIFAAHPDAEPLLVVWHCTRTEAEREIFHRYAARPRHLAELELARYLADADVRQLAAAELDGAWLVHVGAGMPLGDQVLRVIASLQPRSPPCEPAARRRAVMIVEDDAEERAVLAEVLHELGCDVELAPDASVALALLDDGATIDLVISDQRMPGLSGIELLRELGARHPHVRAVLLTGHGDDALCDEAMGASAVTVLAKPVHVVDLARALDESTAD
jgi:CheY-like chemotaxis protein